jgi:DNA polymerase-3 subunit beta
MKFRIAKQEFLHALHLIQNIVQKRTTLPVLSYTLVETREGRMTLTATDLDVGMKVKVSDLVVEERGAICVNAKKLYEAVRELPDGELAVRFGEKRRFEVESGKVSYQLLVLEPKEFPSFPEFDGGQGVVDPSILEEMIKRTQFAVSSEEVRADINGVLLTQVEGNKFRMVGTDGHRLAVSERTLPGLELTGPVIVSRKGLSELRKVCEEGGELRMGVSRNMVYAGTDTIALFMRTVEGEYPKYERVIPGSARFTLRVEQQALLAALKRVVVLSSDRFGPVCLRVRSGWMELSSNNPELGEAREEMIIEGEGPEIEVSFNSRYILDVTEVLSPNTTMEIALIDHESPGVVTVVGDRSYVYVVMPIRG